MAIIVGVVVSLIVVAGLIAVIVIIAINCICNRPKKSKCNRDRTRPMGPMGKEFQDIDTAAIDTNLGESSFSLDI